MLPPNSLSSAELLQRLAVGDERAAEVIVGRFMTRLIAVVRSRLARRFSRRVDPEDLVMSAWRSFFIGARRQRWSVNADDDLWPILVTIALRKVNRQVERQQAEKRDATRETAFSFDGWNDVATDDPTPEQAAEVIDEIEWLLGEFSAAEQQIIVLGIQGLDADEISSRCCCSARTVRRVWQRAREMLCARNAATASTGNPLTIGRMAEQIASRTAAWGIHQDEFAPPLPAADKAIAYHDLRLLELAGAGAFGKVYRARRISSGSEVAVKFLRKSLWALPGIVAQLFREFELATTVRHPNIIRVHGWGRAPSGGPYLVMDWLAGEPLTNWNAGQLNLGERIADLVIPLAEGLAALHAAGIVHGDLTPANILRRHDGRIVVTDLGLSLRGECRTVFLGGTLGFSAPEQLSDAFGQLSVATDIYGLGGVLYYLFVGRPPYSGGDAASVIAAVLSSQQLSCPLDWPPSARSAWPLVARCLSKEIANRPRDVRAVAHEMAALLRAEQ